MMIQLVLRYVRPNWVVNGRRSTQDNKHFIECDVSLQNFNRKSKTIRI